MQSSRTAEEEKSGIPATVNPVLGQLISGRAFDRMCKIVTSILHVVTFVLAKGGKDYTVPVGEAAQYEMIGKFAKDRFIARHVRKESFGNMFIQTSQEKDVYCVLFEEGIDLNMTPEDAKRTLPLEFRKQLGKIIVLTMYVNKKRDGIVLYMQVLDNKTQLQQARDRAVFFGVDNTYNYLMKICTGCKLKMPVTKKCKVCASPFCSKECMKLAWPSHKTACKRTEDAADVVDAMSKASLVDQSDRCPCGGPGSQICTRCRKQWYCSKECQTACWASHSVVCKKAPPPQPACPKCGAGMDAEGAMGALCSACSGD